MVFIRIFLFNDGFLKLGCPLHFHAALSREDNKEELHSLFFFRNKVSLHEQDPFSGLLYGVAWSLCGGNAKKTRILKLREVIRKAENL